MTNRERIEKAREQIAENRREMAESSFVTVDQFKAGEDNARAVLDRLNKEEQDLWRAGLLDAEVVK